MLSFLIMSEPGKFTQLVDERIEPKLRWIKQLENSIAGLHSDITICREDIDKLQTAKENPLTVWRLYGDGRDPVGIEVQGKASVIDKHMEEIEHRIGTCVHTQRVDRPELCSWKDEE